MPNFAAAPLAVARPAVRPSVRSPSRRAVARRGPAFDPASAAYFDRVEADGGTVIDPPATDRLVRALKAAGAWDIGVAGFATVGGAKLRDASGTLYIAKDYSLFGAARDSAQSTDIRQPTWSTAALNGWPVLHYPTTTDIWLRGGTVAPAELLFVAVRRFLDPDNAGAGDYTISYADTGRAQLAADTYGWRIANYAGTASFTTRRPGQANASSISAANDTDAWQIQTCIKIDGARSQRLQGSEVASDTQAGVIDYTNVGATTYGRNQAGGGTALAPSLTSGFYGDRAAFLAFDVSGMNLAACVAMAEAVEAAVDDIYAVLP